VLLESYSVAGMGHGTPVTQRGAEALGNPGPFMLEAGIASTRRIAAFWGIAPEVVEGAAAVPATPLFPAPAPVNDQRPAAVIDRALRQAGLIR
jgi:hypothetical protein